MDLKEKKRLQDEATRLFYSEGINDCKENLHILADTLFKIFYKHSVVQLVSQRDREARLVAQMIFSKILYLNKMLDGVEFNSINGDKLKNIIDPTIIAGVVRMFFETIAMFNLIYIQPKNEDEKVILYNLWVIAGLKYRQRFQVSNSDGKKKQSEEAQTIQTMIDVIHQTKLYKLLPTTSQATVDRKIKEKDYKIYFNAGTVHSLSWQETVPVMNIKEDLLGQMYTYFSLYSHPSNVSVFQFRDR